MRDGNTTESRFSALPLRSPIFGARRETPDVEVEAGFEDEDEDEDEDETELPGMRSTAMRLSVKEEEREDGLDESSRERKGDEDGEKEVD